MKGIKKKALGGIALLVLVAMSIFVLFPRDVHFVVKKLNFHFITSNITDHPGTHHQKVLLPTGFQFSDQIKKRIQGNSSDDNWEFIQLKNRERLNIPPRRTTNFKMYDTFLYGQSETTDCSRAARSAKFAIDESRQLVANFTKILKLFSEETSTYQDGFNQRIESIIKEVGVQENQNETLFRFFGSSVWLKDFNVHYVVSRLVFSKKKKRNIPTLSLLVAQVYDEFWNELEDVRMVLPSNTVEGSPGFEVDGQSFIVHRFPKILPIPFDTGEKSEQREFWGAEDPRMLLVRNNNGYEEPVVVYNSLHVSESGFTDQPYQRSIFMTFPFQLQRGGLNSPKDSPKDSPHDWFTRSKRLTIKGQAPTKAEKNWTPFVSQDGSFDKHMMFAVQLEPLSVIKCELWTNNGECVIEGVPIERNVGALRGGTPLLSLKLDKEKDKEYFVGFARAHLKNCGCGENFYRPNLIVLLRQAASWKLTHMTSSVDLGMKVSSWSTPDAELCEKFNVMLPNGIEYLDRKSDTLSLLVSISDSTVERVHVKGVLKALWAARFWEAEVEAEVKVEAEDKPKVEAKADAEPEFEPKPDTHRSTVVCALEESKNFCRAYGDRIEGRIPGRFV